MSCNHDPLLPHATSGRVEPCGCRSGGILECVMPTYPPEAMGYYLKRGNFVDQCCAILAQGKWLSQPTIDMAWKEREKPLSTNQATERWLDYVGQFEEWMKLHKVEFVSAQQRVINEIDGYVGTLDLLLIMNGQLTLIDLKCGSMPKCTNLQTALYNIGIGMKAKKRLGLLLTPDKCEEYWFNDYSDYNEARILARAYHIQAKYRA